MKKQRSVLKKLLLICLCAALAVALAAAGINLYVVSFARQYILPAEDAAALGDVDCILVLGAFVRSDGSLSHMLEDRMTYGVDLYEQGAAPKLLLSGDHGTKGYDEVNAMKTFALEAGVPEDDIFMDHAGFSTYESMYRARDVFAVQTVLVVTQGYHLYRAVYNARKLGLEAYGVASDPRSYGKVLYNNTREALARVKDFAYCILQPEPTYGGDVIPISGSGTATQD